MQNLTIRYRYVFLTLVAAFCKTSVPAQGSTFDSLLYALPRVSHDTSKLDILFKLVEQTDNRKEKVNFNNQAEVLSEELTKNKDAKLKIIGEKGIIRAFDNAADFFYFQGNLDSAMEKFNSALKLASEINDKKLIAREFSNLARIYTEQGNFAKALKNQMIALNTNQEIKNADGIIYNYLMFGHIHYAAGNYGESLKSYLISLQLNNESLVAVSQSSEPARFRERKLAITEAYFGIGDNYEAQDNYEKAIEYKLNTLKIFQEIKMNEGIIALYDEIGGDYQKKSDFDKALVYYFKMLRLAEKDNNKQDITTAYERIGFAYLDKQDFIKALKAQEISLKISEELEDEKGTADGYNDIGNIYYEMGRSDAVNYNKALPFYFKALAVYEKLEFNMAAAGVNNEIANTYFKQGKIKQAKENALLSMRVFREANSNEDIKDNSLLLSRCDSALGNYKEAYQYYILYNNYRDSIYDEKSNDSLTKQLRKLEIENVEKDIKTKQDKKDLMTREEIKRQKILRNGFILGFGVVFLFSIIVFRQRNRVRREKKRSDELLLNILPAETARELKATGHAVQKILTK